MEISGSWPTSSLLKKDTPKETRLERSEDVIDMPRIIPYHFCIHFTSVSNMPA